MHVRAPESELWPDEVVQLLDDHHLVVCTNDPAAAGGFAAAIARRLGQMAETQVVVIDGARVRDIPSFCRQIERAIAPASGAVNDARRARKSKTDAASVWWRDIAHVIDLLRRFGEPDGAARPPKRRYFIWNNAHRLLRSDPALFSRLVNALLGAAAEQEHITPDSLVLQRAVFIGADDLADYAEDPQGQFHRWLDEEGSPFWEVASVLQGPPVLTYRLEGESVHGEQARPR